MWSGGSTRGTSNGDWSTCLDWSTLRNENVREMAVADGIVTMTKSNELARTFIIADAFYNTVKYGITRFIVGTQVNTVMKLSLGSWKSHATLTLLAKQECPLWLQYDCPFWPK